MSANSVFISNFAVGGYKSFGKKQHFPSFSKINLLIGQNNSGKSNVLRFIHDIFPNLSRKGNLKFDQLDQYIGESYQFTAGKAVYLDVDSDGHRSDFLSILPKMSNPIYGDRDSNNIFKLLKKKSEIDDSWPYVWFYYDKSHKLADSDWLSWNDAFSILHNSTLSELFQQITNQSGGSRDQHWIPECLDRIKKNFEPINVVMIPAIRKIGIQGSISEDFSGEGIIERLVKLQNPSVHEQHLRDKFNDMNRFLRNVTGNNSAEIEIPHERDTILVHMDSKTLPLESLGTGIHEVVILAAAATVLENHVICMEEPELHLNPLLQKKLVRYLESNTTNQYFISTHSASFMDTANAEIYHLQLFADQTYVRRVTTDKSRSEVCADLGYHPSDLLQANTVIWVEGPSDRIYLNFWIKFIDPKLTEGVHYSIMFYGGRLASHLSGEDLTDEDVEKFISLRRLNRRGVIMIDSDREKPRARINATKKRLQTEFNDGDGHAWITKGREVENYLNPDQIDSALRNIHSQSEPVGKYGAYDNVLSIKSKTRKIRKKSQGDKVKVARYITDNFDPDLERLDLKEQVVKLVRFVHESIV